VGAGEVPGGEDLSGDLRVPDPDVVPGVAEDDVPGELEPVGVRPVVLERDAGAMGLPAVDLDDEPAVGPGEVDARSEAVLRERRGDAVAAADAEEPILEVGLGDCGIVEVGAESARGTPGQRVPDAVVVEDAPELRLPHDAVQGLVIEDVCEVHESPGERGDRYAVAGGSVSRMEAGTVGVDPRLPRSPRDGHTCEAIVGHGQLSSAAALWWLSTPLVASVAAIHRASFVLGRCPTA